MLLKKIIRKITEREDDPVIVNSKISGFANANKILLLRQDRIGDVLVSIAFLKKLRSLFPSAEIDIVLSYKNNSAFWAISKFVNRKYLLEKGVFKYIKLINQIRNDEYDLVIDLLDNSSSTSSILTRFTKAEYKLGFDKKNRKVYTHIVKIPNKWENHIVQRINALLIPFAGTNLNEKSLGIRLSEEKLNEAKELLGKKTKSIRLGINLTGSNLHRSWGVGNHIALLKSLENMKGKLEIFVFTTKGNKAMLDEIEREFSGVSAPFVNSFELFSAMISTCDIVLSPDTSVVHLCSVLDIPCIELCTVTEDPNVGNPWAPLSKHSMQIKISENKSLGLIKVTDVLEALKQIIEEISD